MSESVQSNSAVLVHFTLKLEDGTTAESTRNNGRLGDKTTFSLEPDAAFGVPS
ncbi:FKBP-type peptidyl-prolyl cis-trans isomerase, partial [Escherichia sp. HC-CC]